MMKIRLSEIEKWFADPEAELQKFMNSGQAIMSIVFKHGGRDRIAELNQRDVASLLAEIRMRDWKCGYCRVVNLGTEEECVACGASRK